MFFRLYARFNKSFFEYTTKWVHIKKTGDLSPVFRIEDLQQVSLKCADNQLIIV
jgi:hypothetical protein